MVITEFNMHSKIISLRLIIFSGLFIGLSLWGFGQSTCHIIPRGTQVIDGENYLPGDTLCLDASTEPEGQFFLFRNIHGDANNPIVIINSGGQINIITGHFYGIKFQNCSFIKLSGKGDQTHNYGIYISNVFNEYGTGISIDNKSTNIEIENLEIANTSIAGIYAKTEPFQGDCDNLVTRDNFTMYDIKIHDCYLHDIGEEGFYVGSSKYTGQTIYADANTYPCSGDMVLPHVIEGVEIYNNIVENTGWDGIQVSSTISGCLIYGNTIINDSYLGERDQMSGILIGGGSNCDCYNNKIFDGKGDGIDILGLGNHKIYNNLIVRPGKTFVPSYDNPNPEKHGIWVGDVSTDQNAELLIYNNTIVSPKYYGLKLANNQIGAYKVFNNIIVEPGIFTSGNDSFISISEELTIFKLSNLFKQQISEIQFINSTADNFDLKFSSPAYNAGADLSSLGLTTDIEGRPRPYAGVYDIGAYESQESINGIRDLTDTNKQSPLGKVIPNPVITSAIIQYELVKASKVKLYVVDELGKNISVLVDKQQAQNTYQFEINKGMFGSGFFYVVLECNLGRFTEKLIII